MKVREAAAYSGGYACLSKQCSAHCRCQYIEENTWCRGPDADARQGYFALDWFWSYPMG